ncbi:MAG: hypothetical protein CSA62_02610 [Planctomycetota bacterium]|nr:MAG: hypothetical protein CSA62_02610 [Planctomycetota bacterium]
MQLDPLGSRALEWTKRLVRIGSVSPSSGESEVADALAEILREGGVEIIEHPLVELPDGRRNLYARVGHAKRTLVLSGHMDTVGLEDFRSLGLEPEDGLDPDKLYEHLSPRFGDGYLYGRGALDMKGACAICASVMHSLVESPIEDLSVLFVGVCDEENASLGMRTAGKFLAEYAEREGLELFGFINTDYTSSIPGGNEDARYVYTGSIGKLLPSVLVQGQVTHVGEPFKGISANLLLAEITAAIEGCAQLADHESNELTPPPATLKTADLKEHYDVQTPRLAWGYYNFFQFQRSPSEVIALLLERIKGAVRQAEQRLDESWSEQYRAVGGQRPVPKVLVRTLRELCAEMREDGADPDQMLRDCVRRHGDAYPRITAREAVCELLANSRYREKPIVVLYFGRPFYPGVASPVDHPLTRALRMVANAFSASVPNLRTRRYYPYISDASFAQLPASVERDLNQLRANFPGFDELDVLDVDTIRKISMPVINLGPYGYGAHQETERIDIAYSFGILPRMLRSLLEYSRP